MYGKRIHAYVFLVKWLQKMLEELLHACPFEIVGNVDRPYDGLHDVGKSLQIVRSAGRRRRRISFTFGGFTSNQY